MNNIKPLTPEVWFEESHGFKGGNDNDDGICMPYHSKVTFLWSTAPSVVDLVLSKLGDDVHKTAQQLACVYLS